MRVGKNQPHNFILMLDSRAPKSSSFLTFILFTLFLLYYFVNVWFNCEYRLVECKIGEGLNWLQLDQVNQKKKKKFEGLQRTNVVTGAHLIKTNTYIGVKSRDAQFLKGKIIIKKTCRSPPVQNLKFGASCICTRQINRQSCYYFIHEAYVIESVRQECHVLPSLLLSCIKLHKPVLGSHFKIISSCDVFSMQQMMNE